MPQTYAEALRVFESYSDMYQSGGEQTGKIYDYYHAMFKHELAEYEENFTKWEVNRIY